MTWCDSLVNLNRAFDRPLLREFALRVLFQMSATDSSTLMDAPTASKLGRHRALFLQEEQERPEKFRPYGLPDDEWLAGVRTRLGERRAALGDPQPTPEPVSTNGDPQPTNGPGSPDGGDETAPEVGKKRWADID